MTEELEDLEDVLDPLLPKEQRFVEEYLIDLNGVRAATAAGYKSPHQSSTELMNRPRVKNALEVAKAKRSARVQIDQDQVITELAKIAFTNMQDFATWSERGIILLNSNELNRHLGAAIAEIQQRDTKFGTNLSIKLHSKEKALELLGKHLGMFSERVKLEGGDKPVEHTHTLSEVLKDKLSEIYRQK